MGNPLAVLADEDLPPRDPWASMIMVDLCENIHIHHRDLRTEFSIPEFLEYVEFVEHCRNELARYLIDNPEYEEGVYPDTLVKLGGGARVIEASPRPHRSAYWPDRLLVQLERPGEAEIHVHWRDHRIDLDREQLRAFAAALRAAVKRLDAYESGYESRPVKSIDEVREMQRHEHRPGPRHFKRLVGDARPFVVPEETPTVRTNAEGDRVVAPHWPYKNTVLEHVRSEMRRRGHCLIRAVFDGGDWRAIEGSHRIYAASELDVFVTIQEVDWSYKFQHDNPALGIVTAEDVLSVGDDVRGPTAGYEIES